MSAETALQVLESPQPRGLKRLALAVLALDGTDGGQLSFGPNDQVRLAALCAMDLESRFSRIVEELRSEGFVSLDGGVLTVYAGEPTEGGVVHQQQTSLLQGQTSVLPQGSKRGDKNPQNGKSGSAVSDVLFFYAKTFPANDDKFGEDERREVRAALEIRTARQCKEAILGNKASNYHQGENERNKKYNRISNIFRPKKGKKTRAEVIDYFIEIYRAALATSGAVKSGADPAIVKSRKEEIRRAHRLSHDQEAQERGRRAIEWLEEQGIKTTFRADGYPLWPEEGTG